LVVACREDGRDPLCVLDDGTPDPVRPADTGIGLGGAIDDARGLAPAFLVGVGFPRPRRAVTVRLLDQGLVPVPPLVHASAVLLGTVGVGAGTVVFPNATISRGARLGAHVLVNYNATVGHDTTLGDYTTISPGAQVGGECEIGTGVLVGSGAVILQGLRIGDGAQVGSGAVVLEDVEAGVTVTGIPAKARP
jgi:sugar O-acyltransferase (sialic acid O-acetyltransferase NeuD family)